LSRIKVTILGTAAGVPTKKRAHAAICLTYESASRFTCLFDCGEGTQRQMLMAGLGINSVERIFVTHWHGDHCLGIPGMIDTMGFEGRDRDLYIYGPEAGKRRSRSNPFYPMGNFKVIYSNVPFRGKKFFKVFSEREFRIMSVPAKHGVPAVSYAFLEEDRTSIDPSKAESAGLGKENSVLGMIKSRGSCVVGGRKITLDEISTITSGRKVVYSGDTQVCDNLRDMAKGADLLIQDCTYLDLPGEERAHCHASFPEIVKMTAGLGIKKVVLTHFSRKYGDLGEVRRIVEKYPGFEVAEDLYSVVL
jgi:ribonuclease Z